MDGGQRIVDGRTGRLRQHTVGGGGGGGEVILLVVAVMVWRRMLAGGCIEAGHSGKHVAGRERENERETEESVNCVAQRFGDLITCIGPGLRTEVPDSDKSRNRSGTTIITCAV